MKAMVPRVSIGVPVYNGEQYLENALTALLQQDFEDFELIISDNASTDATPDICQALASRDRRIRYFRNAKNVGLPANHNRTYELARGEFFKWAAHDDDFPRPMLARFVKVFEDSSPSTSVVYSQCEYIDEIGGLQGIDSDHVATNSAWPHSRLAKLIRHIHMYNCIYGLIRSSILRKTRLHGLYPMSDHVLCAELAMLGTFVEISEPLLRIRRHPGRTFAANHTAEALRRLFAPDAKPRFYQPKLWTQVNIELIKAAAVVPPRFRDKVLCTIVAVGKPQWEALRAFAGRQKRRVLGIPYQAPRRL